MHTKLGEYMVSRHANVWRSEKDMKKYGWIEWIPVDDLYILDLVLNFNISLFCKL